MNTSCIKSFFLLLFFFSGYHFGNCQNEDFSDTLLTKSYEFLFDKIGVFYFEPIKGNIYAKAFLNKAKKDKDSIKIIKGYLYLSEINYKNYTNSLGYINNAILFNNGNLNNPFMSYVYNQKGKLFHKKGKYKEALEYYLKTKKQLTYSENPNLSISVEQNIGLVRLRIKDFKNALISFNKSHDYIINNNLQKKHFNDYLNTVNALSIVHLYMHELDSATYYNNIEIKEAKNNSDRRRHGISKIIQAYINYEKENFQPAFDSISKYIVEEERDSINLAISHLYLGKIAYKLGNEKYALNQFKKVDTIVQHTQKYLWEISENYEILWNYYKEKKDLKNQLIYVEKLLDFHNTLNENNTDLKSTISNKYDNAKLITEKETLIRKLQKNNRKKSITVYALSGSVLLLLIVAVFFYIKRTLYKKRFEILLKERDSEEKVIKPIKKGLTIPENIVFKILEKIIEFENQKEYIDNKITLDSLAKKLKTNSNYLSRTINHHKGKNFSTYLTDLRINHTIELLKKEPKYRNYTIKAIAFEVGFKNSKSFTNAFYKHTKLYPSYFIKELQKREKYKVNS